MPRLLNARPDRGTALILALLPFALLVAAYLLGSAARLAQNPDDKLLPAPAAMIEAVRAHALEPDRRSGAYLLWSDTAASLRRLGLGITIAAAMALTLGTTIGLLPYVRATLDGFVAVVSMVPALSILPILFILFGLGELSKVVLVVIGTAPFLIRDVALRAQELPEELLIKAQTLGASSWQIALRVVVPLVLPRLLQATRLAIGPAWLFVIAAEAIAATEGLGYRIFLVRRFLAMDVILPYVAWITLLAFLIDRLLLLAIRRLYPWSAPR
jgi:NitT/TauT family transport system permease protein